MGHLSLSALSACLPSRKRKRPDITKGRQTTSEGEDDDDSVFASEAVSGAYSKRGFSHNVNEDACAVLTLPFGASVAVVADGHGGDAASHFVCDSLASASGDIVEFVERSKFEASERELKVLATNLYARMDEEFLSSTTREELAGACVAMAVLHEDSLIVTNVGDCAVAARTPEGDRKLTVEHVATDPIEQARILKQGGFVEQGRVLGALVPSRTIGDRQMKSLVPAIPSVRRINCASSVFVAVYSDGVAECLSPSRVLDVVERTFEKHGRSDSSARRAAKAVVSLCREMTVDDVTCAVLYKGDA